MYNGLINGQIGATSPEWTIAIVALIFSACIVGLYYAVKIMKKYKRTPEEIEKTMKEERKFLSGQLKNEKMIEVASNEQSKTPFRI